MLQLNSLQSGKSLVQSKFSGRESTNRCKTMRPGERGTGDRDDGYTGDFSMLDICPFETVTSSRTLESLGKDLKGLVTSLIDSNLDTVDKCVTLGALALLLWHRPRRSMSAGHRTLVPFSLLASVAFSNKDPAPELVGDSFAAGSRESARRTGTTAWRAPCYTATTTMQQRTHTPIAKKTARFTAHDSCPAGVGNEEEMVPSVGPVFISGRDRGPRCRRRETEQKQKHAGQAAFCFCV